ncbi:MAG TPA: metalloregulator ArsR/SmtB family transcription factor [Dokdonella sp.]
MSNLDLAFAALADPTRRRIVARLTRGEIRVTDLALPFRISLNAVSKHVKVLERAGLVRRERIGREHYLHLRALPLRDVVRWASQYERFWTQRLDALGEFLADRDNEEKTDD